MATTTTGMIMSLRLESMVKDYKQALKKSEVEKESLLGKLSQFEVSCLLS